MSINTAVLLTIFLVFPVKKLQVPCTQGHDFEVRYQLAKIENNLAEFEAILNELTPDRTCYISSEEP